jgi:chromosome segregation ATPase
MRVLSEKYQAEMETIKAQLDAEVSENRSKLQGDVTSLQEDVETSSKELQEALTALEGARGELEEHRRAAEERTVTINNMKDQMLCFESAANEARSMRTHFDGRMAESKEKLDDMIAEKEGVLKTVEERDARIAELQTELEQQCAEIKQLEAEKETLLNDSVSPEEYLAMEERAILFEGEKNQSRKMTESLQKDMKKVVKELQHQIWLVEEDLARSNERCEQLQGVMAQMADDDLKRLEEEELKKSTSGLMGKMKSMKRQSSLSLKS